MAQKRNWDKERTRKRIQINGSERIERDESYARYLAEINDQYPEESDEELLSPRAEELLALLRD